jgi:SNF2 family DNA or RNA helicase
MYTLPDNAPEWMVNIENHLLPHQRIARQFIIDNPQCGLFLTMGGGKTLSTLSAQSIIRPPGHTLIIAPLNIAKNTWTQEIEDWGFPVRTMSLSVRESKRNDPKTNKPKMVKLSKEERHARLQNVLTDPPTFYIASASNLVDMVEYFATDGGRLTHPQYSRWPFPNVIIDESQMFKDPTIRLSKAMLAVRPFISRIQLMTGTPRSEELGNLFGQMLLIDQGQRLGVSMDAFRQKYFFAANTINGKVTKWVPRKGAEDEIYSLISDITISPYNTALDTLPPMEIHDELVELNPSQQEDYTKLAKDSVLSFANELHLAGIDTDDMGQKLFIADDAPEYVPLPQTQNTELQNIFDHISAQSSQAAHTQPSAPSQLHSDTAGTLTNAAVTYITAKNQAALRMKLLQFASGAIYLEDTPATSSNNTAANDTAKLSDGRYYMELHSEKIQQTLRILHPIDTDKHPVLICYRFVFDQDRLRKHLTKAGYEVETFDGSPEMVKRWNNRQIPVMLLQPASAAHGLNLQHGGSTMIWYALPDSSEKYQQANARLHRIGQTEQVDIYRIITKGTVDENLPDVLLNKAKGEKKLLDAVRRDVLS